MPVVRAPIETEAITRTARTATLTTLEGTPLTAKEVNGVIELTGSGGNPFTVGGTVDALAAFGIAEQAYTATSTTANVTGSHGGTP